MLHFFVSQFFPRTGARLRVRITHLPLTYNLLISVAKIELIKKFFFLFQKRRMNNSTTTFDWKTYLRNYPDLTRANIVTEQSALDHWNSYGRFEGRSDKYKNFFNETDIIKYPILFHKYLLGISSPTAQINYEIVNMVKPTKEQICHIHIYDINKNDEYIYYLNIIKDEFNVIITFNIGKSLITEVTVLQVNNRGYDIGPKLCMLQFLIDRSIDYDYILFLHSKSNKKIGKELFNTFIKNNSRVRLLKNIMETNKQIMGVFPNWCYSKAYINKCDDYFKYNNYYFNEMLSFLNVRDMTKEFIGGNMMVLRRPVIDRIFSYNINIFYNMLNDTDSFDINWYTIVNKLDITQSPESLYDHFKSSTDKIGNNLKGCHLFPDGMIEHVFERIWLNIIKEIKGDFLVLPKDKEIDKCNLANPVIITKRKNKLL